MSFGLSFTSTLLVLALALMVTPRVDGGRKRMPTAGRMPTAPERSPSPPALQTLEGTFEVQTDDESHSNILWLELPKRGGRRQLTVPESQLRQQPMSGSKVRVYLDAGTDARVSPLPVRYLEVLQLPRTIAATYPMRLDPGTSSTSSGGAGTPDPRASAGFSTVRLTSVTIILRVCGQEPNITLDEFRTKWHTTAAAAAAAAGQAWTRPPLDMTMQGYVESCSYGKVRFDPADNIVLGPIDVPCSGTSSRSGVPYNASACTADDVYGFADAAEAAVKEAGVDLSRFRQRLLVLPQLASCGWKGLAEVGCGDSCYAWVKGVNARALSTMFHEMTHNLGAEHAAVPGSTEYGDPTDPLGACCTVRCPNAPHAWQLGWAEAVANLDSGGLPVGVWRSFTLPSLALSDTNMLRVTADWLGEGAGQVDGTAGAKQMAPSAPSVFVSYRTAEGYDVGLDEQSAGRVSVHVFNGTRYGTNGARTQLQARLLPGEWWGAGAGDGSSSGGTGAGGSLPWRLNVTVGATGGVTARISVCRADAEAMETSCGDLLDNDCDGLTDDEDPDCGELVAELPNGGSGIGNGNGDGSGSSGCNRNGACEVALGETATRCPADCPAQCGDGYCDLHRNESASSCPGDCGARCGDGFCDAARGESHIRCSIDCLPDMCGDGVCGESEDPVSCARDCCGALGQPRCGDGVCDAFAGENCVTCLQDCRGKKVAGGESSNATSSSSNSITGGGVTQWIYCCGAALAGSTASAVGPGGGGCQDARCNKGSAACRTTCVA